MQLDPTRWLVSWAGFTYDLIITREWTRALLCLIPAILLSGLGIAVAAGGWLDRGKLAQHYLELGNEEIAQWEQVWAPATGAPAAGVSALDEPNTTQLPNVDALSDEPTSAGSPTLPPGDNPGDDSADASSPTAGAESSDKAAENKVSAFAEALFRRVQLLNPSDRSQFVIAATLAQRGAVHQAKAMLAKIAPTKGRGYVPAHAMLAQLLIFELQRQPVPKSRIMAEELIHHAEQAKQWDRVPRSVLLAASDLNVMVGKFTEAVQLLKLSAERYPDDNFAVAQLAKHMKNEPLFKEASPKAQQSLLSDLAADPHNTTARLRLTQLYAMNDDLDRAEQLLEEVAEEERPPDLRRVYSNIFLTRYDRSLVVENGKASVNFQHLETALQIDPSNPLIAQAVAKLVRLQGPRPSQELIDHLLERLAAGSATAVTHAYIAELYLVREDFAKAIPHLEQVVQRLPNATEYLNNLAYCLAELHPERCEEALALSMRAVELSKRQPNSDYYDTLCYVLSRLDRHLEAVTAIENAIELDPNRPQYHARAAAEYRLLNNESMAEVHERLVQRLQAPPPTSEQTSPAAAQAPPDDASQPTSPTDATPPAASQVGETGSGEAQAGEASPPLTQ